MGETSGEESDGDSVFQSEPTEGAHPRHRADGPSRDDVSLASQSTFDLINEHYRNKNRTQLTTVLLMLHLVVAFIHVQPSLVYVPRPVTTVVVVYLSQLGPTWVAVFGGSSLWLIVTLLRNRGRHWAHLVCAATWLMYSSALWYGAIASGGPVLLPVITTAVVLMHATVAASYNEDPRRVPGSP